MREYKLEEIVDRHLAPGVVGSILVCHEQTLPLFRFHLLGPVSAARQFTIHVPDPTFSGRVTLRLGPGDGTILLDGAGPICVDIRMWRSSSVRVDKGTTINGAIVVADHADICVGEDNLWSDDILIQSNDQHGIIDLSTLQLMKRSRRKVDIGRHVWLGRRCLIMPDIVVGDGSIVAAGTVVVKSVSRFVAVGGNPAQLISENRTWSRSPSGLGTGERALIDRIVGLPAKVGAPIPWTPAQAS